MNEKKDGVSVEAVIQSIGNIGPVAVSMMTTNQWWGFTFVAAYSLYAMAMQLRKERIEETAKFISDNPEAFREEIAKSKEFQDGFLIWFEDYLKIRIQKKRNVLRQILLGFAVATNKNTFELERMDSRLEQMSVDTMDFLVFFQREIYPKIESDLQQEKSDILIDFTDRSAEWHHDMALLKIPIWDYVAEWLRKNFDPDSEKVKSDYGMSPTNAEWNANKLARASTRNQEERTRLHEAMLELDTLGIIEKRAVGGGWGAGTANSFYLTHFGIRFLKYFNESTC